MAFSNIMLNGIFCVIKSLGEWIECYFDFFWVPGIPISISALKKYKLGLAKEFENFLR